MTLNFPLLDAHVDMRDLKGPVRLRVLAGDHRRLDLICVRAAIRALEPGDAADDGRQSLPAAVVPHRDGDPTNASTILLNGASIRYNLAVGLWRHLQSDLNGHDNALASPYRNRRQAQVLAHRLWF